MINFGNPGWDEALRHGLINLSVSVNKNGDLSNKGHDFINMCSCSYLGLDTDSRILEGAKQGIDRAGILHLTTARVRIYIDLLEEFEVALSHHFDCHAMSFNSCAAATSAFLPVLASGYLTDDIKPLMVFDKLSHFSIKHIIPICGDETEVEILSHNDMNKLEDLCKKNQRVCYIGDGTYSMGGLAAIENLLYLQKKYGLFLFLDDSHGLSITYSKGWGYIRGSVGDMNLRTVIVTSLAKAFGTCGGMLMSGNPGLKSILERFGNAWSQYLNSAGLGAGLASLKIHESEELISLQDRLTQNLALFDKLMQPQNKGAKSPIRLIPLPSADRASEAAQKVFELGFYTSPVFFPIIPKETAGLRVMPKASLTAAEIERFCGILKSLDLDKKEATNV